MDTVKPFVKWAGGKNRLLAQIEQYFPRELDRGTIVNYIEPFLGGGALFFLLSRKYEIEKSYLFDMNKDLILTYHVIQKGAEDLLVFLEQYQKEYDNLEIEGRKKLFLDTRERFNSKRFEVDYGRFSKNWILRAAQFIFLNKTCFNGLFRLNAKGEFNVPFGSYKKSSILNEEKTIAVSRCLKNSRIIHANYTDCWDFITKDSFVYFDPPYRPINQTSKFTA
jgi:DNA adenine methylase